MCCLRVTNVQHSKNCFARDNFSRTIFVVELPNFHNTLRRALSMQYATACLYFR
ncbi:Uncharacterized protein FWK35_00039313 [Aphis craccivora]|uniref:Uncharacterized protein n=1 Tax=Aphis craccivora TaxID=307492 RepID=A0A6G0VK54_APHCR|nr:Uncharacterized protein FWK35_00039313 [Aphis craccivora]